MNSLLTLNYPFSPLQVTNRGEAHLELNAFRRKHDCALVISGDSLEVRGGLELPAPASAAGASFGQKGLHTNSSSEVFFDLENFKKLS